MALTTEEEQNVQDILKNQTSVSPPEPFDFEPNNWETWRNKFLEYVESLKHLELEDKVKVHLLKHLLGEGAEQMFVDMKKHLWIYDEECLEQVIYRIGVHFVRVGWDRDRRNAEKYYNLYERKQQKGESVTEYVNAIKELATKCGQWDETRYDIMMTNKMFTGLQSDAVRERMLMYNGEMNFNVVLEIALNDEKESKLTNGEGNPE